VLSGRGIAQDFSTFEPTQTYILATNHLPVVKSQDDGTWRRFVVVPWPVRLVENPTDADLAAGALPLQKDFEDGLAEELPGILRWIVDGAKAWMECGLQPPQKVVEATAAYRHQQDAYRPFMEGCAVRGPRAEVGSTPFYQAYEEFQTLRGEPVDAHRTFTLHLRSHYGLEPKKDSKGRMVFRGIGLRPREEWPQPDGEDTEGTEHTEG
jgi:putative DNA primase/helicase